MKEGVYEHKNLYYRVNDFQPARPTLVFVHGLSGSSSAWATYEERFKNSYNVLTFDIRGHGVSMKPRSYAEYSMRHFSDDLYDLVRHLGIAQFVLVGHSFGSLINLGFVAEHHDMIRAAVFLSPHYNVHSVAAARLIKPLLALLIKFELPLPFPKPRTHIDYKYYRHTGDWNVRRMFADIRNTGLRVYIYCTMQSYDFNGENTLANIRMPVLLVHGKRDTIFPVRYAETMAARIKGSKLVLIEDADHILVLNHEERVIKEIDDFVKNLPAM